MALLQLQKVTYKGDPIGEPMVVKYAPAELSFTKSVQFAEIAIPGLDQPLNQFVRGNAETLSLELFFDAETNTKPGTADKAVSVTPEVLALQKLVTVDGELHAPPMVRVSWGGYFTSTPTGPGQEPAKDFTAVVLSAARKYTLFAADGRPLRATVTLSLRQYATVAEQVAEINARPRFRTRTHVVVEGETLPLIAKDAYGDVSKWTLIADANGLDNVMDLQTGTQLTLPPLEGP